MVIYLVSTSFSLQNAMLDTKYDKRSTKYGLGIANVLLEGGYYCSEILISLANLCLYFL